jgi:hypothetical protein
VSTIDKAIVLAVSDPGRGLRCRAFRTRHGKRTLPFFTSEAGAREFANAQAAHQVVQRSSCPGRTFSSCCARPCAPGSY